MSASPVSLLWHAFIMYRGAPPKPPQLEPSPSTQRGQGLLKNKLWRSETKCKKKKTRQSPTSGKKEVKKTKPRLTHKRAIKITQQLPHSLTPATEKKKVVYTIKTFALKLHQARRNAEQPEANRMVIGHYSMLEAAERLTSPTLLPVGPKRRVNFHCSEEHREA